MKSLFYSYLISALLMLAASAITIVSVLPTNGYAALMSLGDGETDSDSDSNNNSLTEEEISKKMTSRSQFSFNLCQAESSRHRDINEHARHVLLDIYTPPPEC